MFPKRLLALTLFTALAVMPTGVLRAQWVQTNGPYGGDVSCFAAMGTYVFAGAYDCAGVFRSTDSGVTWKSASSNFSGVTAIGTIGTSIIAASNIGVFYSTDSGASWKVSANIYGGGGFSPVTGIVTIGRNLFASINSEDTWSTTYLSRDSGKTWIDTGKPPGVIESLIVSNGKIFAGTDGGVFLSNDTGENWTKVSTGLSETYIMSMAAIDSTLFVVAGNSSWTFFQIFISTDDGSSWNPTNDSLPRGLPLRIAAGNNINSVHTILVGGDSGVFLSTDNGQSWIDGGLQDVRIQSVSIMGTNFLAGTLNGLLLSTDTGKKWILVGLPCTNVYSIAVGDTNLFAGINNGGVNGYVFRSSNNGKSWLQTSFGSWDYEETPVSALTVSGPSLIVSGGGFSLSTDNGTSWTGANNGLGGNPVNCFAVSGERIFAGTSDGVFLTTDNGAIWNSENNGMHEGIFAIAIGASNIFVGCSHGVFRSPNNGASWGASSNGMTDSVVSALAISGSNVFAGTYTGGAFLSTDLGRNWASANNGLSGYVKSFAASGSNIFAGTDSGIFLSFNNGENWKAVNDGLSASYIHNLVIKDSILFAATDRAGVWRRPLSEMIPRYEAFAFPNSLSFGNVAIGTDSSLPFKFWNPGNTAITITSIAFTPRIGPFTLDSTFVLPVIIQPGASLNFGTTFIPAISGVQFDTITIMSEAQEVNIPLRGNGIEAASVNGTTVSKLTLHIYPNPFSQSTQITFSSQSAGYAEVSIVNMLGLEVARLLTGELGSGEHNLPWSTPAGLQNGVYECLVRVNGQVQTLPIILLR